MPSLTAKATRNEAMEGLSNTDAANSGPLGQALNIVDKKVRNLEKRKGKLDGYRADYRSGKELNDDQKSAIAKYDEVVQTLDFARELSGQFKTLAIDEEKAKKKQLKKEKQERSRDEITKVASILEVDEFLKALSDSKVKNDFMTGENGAIKLTDDQLGALEEFIALMNLSRKEKEDEGDLTTCAEHLISLVEGRSKKVGKSSYKEMKTLLNSIKNCGYFKGKTMEDITDVSSSGQEEESEVESRKPNGNTEPSHVTEPEDNIKDESETPKQQDRMVNQEHQAHQEQHQTPKEHHQPPPTHYQSLHRNQQPPTSAHHPNETLNFLQDSEIDMESPHMDPAVVVVHHTTPHQTPLSVAATTLSALGIPTQTFTNQMYIPPTTLAAIHQQTHMQQQMHHQYQIQQQEQQTQPQDLSKRSSIPAPGFSGSQDSEAKSESRPLVNQEQQQLPDDNKSKGYAAITARNSVSEERDTFTNISEWNEDSGNGSKKQEVRNAGSRGRGRGRGQRGEFRGGRGGKDDRGYRGDREQRGGGGGNRGEKRGGKYNGERRGGGGERRGRGFGERRGGEKRYQGERSQQSNGYGEKQNSSSQH